MYLVLTNITNIRRKKYIYIYTQPVIKILHKLTDNDDDGDYDDGDDVMLII